MLKIELQFDNPEAAIVVLDAYRKTVTPSAAPVASEPSAAPEQAQPGRQRKPRADAGKVRGSYKNTEASAEAAKSTLATVEGKSDTAPASVAGSIASVPKAAAPQPPTAPQKAAPSQEDAGRGVAASAAAPVKPATKPALFELTPSVDAELAKVKAANAAKPEATLEATQNAMEALFKAKGLPAVMDLMARFGVARAKDLLPEQRAEFLELATEAAK